MCNPTNRWARCTPNILSLEALLDGVATLEGFERVISRILKAPQRGDTDGVLFLVSIIYTIPGSYPNQKVVFQFIVDLGLLTLQIKSIDAPVMERCRVEDRLKLND